jgi:uncharacterized protein involved in exopolysaccharide biosynthesis
MDEYITINEPQSRATLRDYVAPIFRRRRLFTVCFVGMLLGTLAAVLLLPAQYESETTILVKPERADLLVTPGREANTEIRPDVSEEMVNSEVELLQARELLEKVVVTNHLDQAHGVSLLAPFYRLFPSSPEDSQKQAMANAIKRLQKKLKVEPLKKTNLIKVTYKATNPETSQRVLKTLEEVYLEKHVAVHRPPGPFTFFQQQTTRYQNELSQAEQQLSDFNVREGVISADVEKGLLVQRIGEFDGKLRDTQAATAEAQERIRKLESQAQTIPPRITTQVKNLTNPVLQQLTPTLLALELKRTELLRKFQPEYPAVLDVEREIQQTRSAIAQAEQQGSREETTDEDSTHAWVRSELVKAQTDLNSLRGRASALSGVLTAYQKNVQELEQRGRVQQDLLRDAKAAEENYLLYLRKQEEARISDALDQERIGNVAVAESPTLPFEPVISAWLMLMLGTCVSGFVSLGTVFAFDYMDPTFRTPDELKGFLEAPVLASLPADGER